MSRKGAGKPQTPNRGSTKGQKAVPGAIAGSKTPSKAPSRPQERRKAPTWLLVLVLIIVVLGGVLFIGAVSGWFGPSEVELDPEYYNSDTTLAYEDGDFLELLTPERLSELTGAGKSFVVFIDQSNCVVANRMRGFVTDYAKEAGIKVYRMMFSEMKETPLHEEIKYYPSMAIVSDGSLVAWLDADSDEDAAIYNDYGAFQEWMNQWIK